MYSRNFQKTARHDRCMQNCYDFGDMRRVEGPRPIACIHEDTAYRHDRSASSFDDPIGCNFMASSATWAAGGARSLAVCRLLTAATS